MSPVGLVKIFQSKIIDNFRSFDSLTLLTIDLLVGNPSDNTNLIHYYLINWLP